MSVARRSRFSYSIKAGYPESVTFTRARHCGRRGFVRVVPPTRSRARLGAAYTTRFKAFWHGPSRPVARASTITWTQTGSKADFKTSCPSMVASVNHVCAVASQSFGPSFPNAGPGGAGPVRNNGWTRRSPEYTKTWATFGRFGPPRRNAPSRHRRRAQNVLGALHRSRSKGFGSDATARHLRRK
jgi:hypothetical protein